MYSRLELRFCNICMPSKMVKAQKGRLVMSRFFRFYTFRFTTLRELAPLFSPNRQGTCDDANRSTLLLAIARTCYLTRLVLGSQVSFPNVKSSASASSKTVILTAIRNRFACKHDLQKTAFRHFSIVRHHLLLK